LETGLRDKVVVVTGASGGIGAAVARRLGGCGARLVLHYRSGLARARALARELQGVETLLVRADLAREGDARRLFARSVARFGRVDTLVANAGWWEARDVPLQRMSLAQWRRTQDAVLTSAFLSLREFLRLVARQRRGNAVLVASTAALFGEAGHADYAAAKAGLAYGLTLSLKNEIARLAPLTARYVGGRINCVAPGWTIVPRTTRKFHDAAAVRRVAATRALPKIARPDDVAAAVAFLASDALAGQVTGQILTVAGGMEGRLLWRPEEVDPRLA
jgi:3-oxoacyl-[acyl-carrier protein] reductase